jgi:hypothetical protein
MFKGTIIAAPLLFLAALPVQAQQANMTFFITSTPIGNGGNLGGLAGADNQCQTLAQAAGAGAPKVWRAYLSTQAADGKPASMRATGSEGPWTNAKGDVVAKDVADLHGPNALTKQSALNEKGEVINGRGDQPNRHDILTGSQPDGTAFAAGDDKTCKNWTSSTQARPLSAIPTGSACAMTMRRNRGIRRTARAGRRADARRRTCEAPAATACCIVSHRTDWSFRRCS